MAATDSELFFRRRAVCEEVTVRERKSRLAAQVETVDEPVLVGRAAGGDLAAFDQLYRMHADAAWRVANAVTGNADDASDAVADAFVGVLQAVHQGRLQDASRFRSYLLTATRNAAIDGLRRTRRVEPADMGELAGAATATLGSASAGPPEHLVAALDAAMVASAFRSLPERWRSVLWLTEVEGMRPGEAAGLLGVSANGAAQLAVRARAGLRERYLQAHLNHGVDEDCEWTVARLGAYVGGGVAARDLAKVDQHLTGCEACRARHAELEDLGGGLRRAVLPLPLGLAAVALGRWKLAALGARAGAAHAGAGWGAALGRAWHTAQRPLLVASLGMASLGIVAAAVVGERQPLGPGAGGAVATTGRDRANRSAATTATASGPPIVTFRDTAVSEPAGLSAGTSGVDVSAAAPASSRLAQGADAGSGAGSGGAAPAPPGAPVPIAGTGSGGTGSGSGPSGSTGGGTSGGGGASTPPVAATGAGVVAGPIQGAVAVTVAPACTGAAVGTTTVGCSVPAPTPSPSSALPLPVPAGATVTTAGQITGSNTIHVP